MTVRKIKISNVTHRSPRPIIIITRVRLYTIGKPVGENT